LVRSPSKDLLLTLKKKIEAQNVLGPTVIGFVTLLLGMMLIGLLLGYATWHAYGI
jgi:hypothetical protein